jgi:rubredoxin
VLRAARHAPPPRGRRRGGPNCGATGSGNQGLAASFIEKPVPTPDLSGPEGARNALDEARLPWAPITRHDNGDDSVKRYMCMVCGFIYDEAEGWPDDGIAPGTKWADVPDTWLCPECGVGKEDFEMEEI